MFADEMMGPERMEKRKQVDAVPAGGEADYDHYFRSGSFTSDLSTKVGMTPRGSLAQGDEDGLDSEPDSGLDIGEEEPQFVQEAGTAGEGLAAGEAGGRSIAGRTASVRRPGPTSLEPMAFGRERAGTVVGSQDAPFTPDIRRNDEDDAYFDQSLEHWQKKNPRTNYRPLAAQFLGWRMGMNNDRKFLGLGDGKPAQVRAPLTQDEIQAEGDKLDYQYDKSQPNQRYLSEQRNHQFWMQAHPEKPDAYQGDAPFMSEPDAGWDRVKSRGFLGVPWLLSMLGSKLFGTKGGRYDQRKADLARRKGTFERARETYGLTTEGRQGVMPKWIGRSNWARQEWASADKRTLFLMPNGVRSRLLGS